MCNCLPKTRNEWCEVEIEAIHVERKSVLKLDKEKRLLLEVNDDELLQSRPNQLVASKAIVKMNVNGLNKEYSPSVAIALDSKAEEIAFGTNVKICSNFTIFSADCRFSTRERTKKRLITQELLEMINKLIPNTEKHFEQALERIDSLTKQVVTKAQWNQFIGEWFSKIHYVNRMRLARIISKVPKEIKELPLTAALLAEICAEAIEPSHSIYDWEGEITNKWNCLNYGTEIIKASRGLATQAVIDNNIRWTSLLLGYNFSDN